MKGAVKNAINCKLIFGIKANRGRPLRRVPGDFTSLNPHEVRATSKRSKTGALPFLIVLSFPLSFVPFYITAKPILPDYFLLQEE